MVASKQGHKAPLRTVLEAYTAVTTATYTAKAGDRVIGVNRAGTVTVTLPTAEVRPGRVYTVKDESGAAATNNITVDTEGAENIDGASTDVINVNYESKSYYSDGTNWFILPVTPDTNTQNAYEAPGLTLGTSNVEGTGNSIRSGATVLAFDATDPSTQAHSDAATVGSATVAARRDHKHAMPAVGTNVLKSTIVSGSRLGSAGAGDQAITGAGFAPTAMFIWGVDESTDYASWGFGDDADAEADISHEQATVRFNTRTNGIVNIDPGTSDSQTAVLKTLDADGCTLTWSIAGSGIDTDFKILFLG